MDERVRKVTVVGLAILSFLAPIKFTNPVVLYDVVYWPGRAWEWLVVIWPNTIFYAFLLPLMLSGLWLVVCSQKIFQRNRNSKVQHRTSNIEHKAWLWPVLFLIVQFASAIGTVDSKLTQAAISLFCGLAVGYFLGWLILRDTDDLQWVALGWLFGGIMLAFSGILQATGGLEQTRQFLHAHPEWAQQHSQLWKWVESNRIFATFVSPNALGGYIVSAVFVIAAWCLRTKRLVIGGTVILMLLYCLWRSQSKGSYAALFATVILAVLLLARRRHFVWITACGVLALVGFGMGYGSHSLEKGKRTLEARTGYWKAAWQIGWDHPILGSGPGTFARMYPRYKQSGDEDTVLVHNNYLQMWSDSGLLGVTTFMILLPGTLWLWVQRYRKAPPPDQVFSTLLWCACAAFALHSLVDFDLYMISNSWPIFVLLGYLNRECVLKAAHT